MKKCWQKNKILVIKEQYYRIVSSPEQWKTMLHSKYGIPHNMCFMKHKKGVCWLFAKSEILFDKQGYVCKSSRKLFNSQLRTEFCYHNVYDVHCRLVQWNMTVKKNNVSLQFPQNLLLQPANMTLFYNEYGDLASASDGKVECTFEYEYDDNGNWIKCFQVVNGKCVEIIVRQLEYSEAEETIAESNVINEIDNEVESEDPIIVYDKNEGIDKEDGEKEILEEEEPSGNTTTGQSEPSDNYIGKKVIHSKFGIGEIIKYEDQGEKQYINISFSIGVKRFIYPNAFEMGFLEWL